MSARGHRFYSFIQMLICIFSSAAAVFAGEEESGTVSGKAVDRSTLHPLPGVTVTIQGTGYGAVCDSAGHFIITGVPAGSYNLKATSVGYKTLIKTDVVVSGISPVFVQFELKEQVNVLNDVTVVPEYFQGSSNEPLSFNRLNQEELRRTPGSFDDVIRTVSLLPGVAQSDQLRNDLIVRGGGPSENLFILDGFTMPSISHFASQSAATGPSSYVNLDFVSSASFSTGGFSSIYGDKSSSVLQINLREARQDRIGAKAMLSVSMFTLAAEGPLSDKTSFLFSARRSYLDILFRSSGFVFVPEFYDLTTKVKHKFDGRNTISFLLTGALDNVKLFNKEIDPRRENPRAMGSNQHQYMAGVSYRHLTEHGYYTLSLSRYMLKYVTVPNMIFENNSSEAENTLKADLALKLSGSDEISAGASAKIINFHAALFLKDFMTTYKYKLHLTRTDRSEEYYKAGAYINYNKRLPFGLSVTAGVRADYFEALKDEYSFAPRISVSYELNALTTLSLSSGIYYQTPSYIWLHTNSINRRLKSIRSDHYIAGISHKLREDVLLKAEGFYKVYSDYPASIPNPYLVMVNTGAGFSGMDDNFSAFGLEALNSAGRGYSRGLELMIQKKSSRIPHYGMLSVSYSKAEFAGNDGVMRPGSYDQRLFLNLTVGYIFNSKWQANIKFRYGTGKPYTPFSSDGVQQAAKYNSERFPANHQLDIRIDRRWLFKGWNLTTYLDIQNIYNRKNISFIRWDYKAREIADDPVLGIAPSFGITAEI